MKQRYWVRDAKKGWIFVRLSVPLWTMAFDEKVKRAAPTLDPAPLNPVRVEDIRDLVYVPHLASVVKKRTHFGLFGRTDDRFFLRSLQDTGSEDVLLVAYRLDLLLTEVKDPKVKQVMLDLYKEMRRRGRGYAPKG